jgi:hypothetical protein
MATRELTVQIPDQVYRRLKGVAQEFSQSLEAIVLTSITGNLPPSLDDVPADLREEMRALQTLDDDALWAVARSKLPPEQQARLEVLLSRNNTGTLTKMEREELKRSGEEVDRLTLRKAQAYALLRWRGFPLPSPNDQTRQS